MPITQYVTVFALSVVGGVLLGEIMGRFWKWSAPTIVQEIGYTCRYCYLYPFRWVTPDSVYKLYLRTGLIDADTYREFQQANLIRDDIDPNHIRTDAKNE